MTLLVAVFLLGVAMGVGVLVGRRRGPVVGVASGAGVLVVGAVGYIGLLALALPM
jgi:hypothetical protein